MTDKVMYPVCEFRLQAGLTFSRSSVEFDSKLGFSFSHN